jgi:hypothetical protein
MRIRLVMLPPAPLVDGFDVGQYRGGPVGEIYDVEPKLARYLILAGHAETASSPIAEADDRLDDGIAASLRPAD